MTPSQNLLDKLKEWEGCILHAYQDDAGVWTIGIGSTLYSNGKHIMKGDVITLDYAFELLKWEVNNKTAAVSGLLHNVVLNQNQFDALVSLTFNIGVAGFANSTVLKRVKNNPNDSTIADAFLMWDKIHKDGQLVENEGLKHRRQNEIKLYFS